MSATIAPIGRARKVVGTISRHPGITRRDIQIALGLLRLLDGVLRRSRSCSRAAWRHR
jgi:hypothetical protein